MRGSEGMGVLRCWIDQVDVHDPEFTAACSYDICLWVGRIRAKAHFVSEFRVQFVIPGVIHVAHSIIWW